MKLNVSCVLIVLLLCTRTTLGDLRDIDRRITKEPAYENQPYYALLVFGMDADSKAWLVLDGETLYVDRNCNGDLTESGEQVPLDVDDSGAILVASGSGLVSVEVFDVGKIQGHQLKFEFWRRKADLAETDERSQKLAERRKQHGWEHAILRRFAPDKGHMQIPLTLTRGPEDAQATHLSGPLTFKLAHDQERTGKRQTLSWPRLNVFSICIGTPGQRAKGDEFQVFSPLTISEVPKDVHPVAHFEFQNRKEGEPPIAFDLQLNQRCCGDTFYARIEIPKTAGDAPAKVTVEIEEWNGRSVAPTSFEIPLE